MKTGCLKEHLSQVKSESTLSEDTIINFTPSLAKFCLNERHPWLVIWSKKRHKYCETDFQLRVCKILSELRKELDTKFII